MFTACHYVLIAKTPEGFSFISGAIASPKHALPTSADRDALRFRDLEELLAFKEVLLEFSAFADIYQPAMVDIEIDLVSPGYIKILEAERKS